MGNLFRLSQLLIRDLHESQDTYSGQCKLSYTREGSIKCDDSQKDAALCLHFHFFPNICTRSWLLWKHLEEEQVSISFCTRQLKTELWPTNSYQHEWSRLGNLEPRIGLHLFHRFVSSYISVEKFEFKLEFQMICLVKVKKTLG